MPGWILAFEEQFLYFFLGQKLSFWPKDYVMVARSPLNV